MYHFEKIGALNNTERADNVLEFLRSESCVRKKAT